MLAETLETKWISEMDQLFYRANQDNFSYKEYLSWLTYYSKNNSSFVRPNLPQAPIEYFAQLFDQQCVLNQQALAQSEFKSAERIIYYDSSTQLLFMIACRQYMESLGKPIRGFGASMTVSIDIH